MSDNVDPKRVAGGLKASIHNPRVSDEAKDRAEERLSEMQGELDAGEGVQQEGKNTSNRLGGYKATLSNPRTSESAKTHAREVLEGYKKEGDMDDPDYVPGPGEPADEE